MKGVLYVRVSSREQEEEGYSVDSQVEHGIEYARRQGIEIVKTWTIAESAKGEDREGFAEMIAYSRSHPDVKAMIFEKADRMTRNYHDLVRIYDVIEKHDKEAHFFKEGFHISQNSKSSEKLRLDIQVVLARNYINNLSEEVTKGMDQKVKKGGFPAVAPTGYLNNVATREIIVDPRQSLIIRKMYETYATGRYSLWDMTKLTQKEGLAHPFHKKPIGRSGIYRILTNPFYYGLIQWNGLIVMGKHEPLVSKALFDRVQLLLGGQKPQPKTKKFAFAGFAVCGHCGSAITAEIHHKKQKNGVKRTYTYYRCTGWKNQGKICDGSHISEGDLVAQLGQPLKGLTIDAPTLLMIRQALKESLKGEKEYHVERVAALRAETTRLDSWIEKAYMDRLDGILTADEYKAKSGTWTERLFEIRNGIRAHENTDATYMAQSERILDLAQRAYDLYVQQTNNYERRKLVDCIISKVVISDRRAVLNLRKPFETLTSLTLAIKSGQGREGWYAREDLNL